MYVNERLSRRRAWFWWGLVLLGLLLLLCTCNTSRSVERSFLATGQTALGDAGLEPELLQVDGRDVSLEGVVDSEATKVAAGAAVTSALPNLRVFSNNLRTEADAEAAPSPDGANLAVALDDDQIVLSGLVPETARADIVGAAAELYGADNVVDNLESAELDRPDWLDGVVGLLPSLQTEAEGAGLNASASGLQLRGLVADEATRESLAALAAEADLPLDNALEVGQAANLRIGIGDNLNVSGVVDEATASAVSETLSPIGTSRGTDLESNLEVRAAEALDTPTWFTDVISLSPRYAEAVTDGSLDLRPTRVSLSGVVADEATRRDLGEAVAAAAGEAVTVVNQLRIATDTPGAQLSLRETEEGVSLNGTLPEAAAASLVEALGESVTDNSLSVGEVDAPTWMSDLLPLTPEILAAVDEAELSVDSGGLSLSGNVASEDARLAQLSAVEAVLDENVRLEDGLRVAELAQPSFSLNEMEESLSLSGTLAPASAEAAEAALSGAQSTLSSDETVAAPEWLSGLTGFLPSFTEEVEGAGLELNGDSVTLTGSVDSEVTRSTLLAELQTATGNEVAITDNLEVAEMPRANLRLEKSEAGTRLSGRLPEALAGDLVDAVTPGTDLLRNDLEAAEVSAPDWLPDLLEAAPAFTDAAENAVLELEGDTVTLGGTVESEAQRTELGEQLSAATGGNAEVINNLALAESQSAAEADGGEPGSDGVDSEPAVDGVVPTEVPAEAPSEPETGGTDQDVTEAETLTEQPATEQPVEAAEPVSAAPDLSSPSLRIDIMGEQVRLTGTVPDETSREAAAEGYGGEVDNALSVGAVAAPDYLPNVLATGPQIAAELGRASLNLQNDSLTLQGVVPDEATKNRIGETLRDQLGAEVTVINRLSVPLDPQSEDDK